MLLRRLTSCTDPSPDIPMKVDLKGQVALVTGAAGGIGQSIASTLAASGARVVYADVNIEAARQCAAATPGALALRMDVTNEAEIEATMAETVDLPLPMNRLARAASKASTMTSQPALVRSTAGE